MCVTWRVHSAQVDVWGLRWPHRAEASHADTSATPRPKPATQKKGARLVMRYSASLILTCTALLTCYFSWSFRPSSVRNCSSEMCDVHWKVFPWRTCTAACGSGFQSRRVECIHRQNKKTLPDQHCAWQRRPSTWQHCNITSCGSESLKTPCYKPERQYGAGNVCPRSPPLERSCFIRENISDLRAKYIGLFRHSRSPSYHSVPRELALVRRFFFRVFFKLGHFRNPVCPNICFLFFALLRWNIIFVSPNLFLVQKCLIKQHQ